MEPTIRIEPKRTALLVIDMQNAFLDPAGILYMPAAEKMIPTVQSVVDACRRAGMLIVWARISHEFLGATVYRELWPDQFEADGTPKLRRGSFDFELHPSFAVLPGEEILDKFKYTAFYGTNLEGMLRHNGCDTVVIAGLATNVCCESTARDAFFRDFRVIMLSDANATINEEMQKAALDNISAVFGFAITSQELSRAIVGFE